tara:strand:+ start:205 stop:516 length:312 start_codon:yes stop_codon:yes gene_type:complete
MTLIKNNVKTTNPTEDLLKAPYGTQGADIIANDADHLGDWYCMISIEDNTTLDNSSCVVNWTLNGTNALFLSGTNLELITGLPYYGDFTQMSLTDGKVIMYRK